MSDAPETDAFFFRTDIEWDDEVLFARNLECERDQARADAANYFARCAELQDERDRWRECAEWLASPRWLDAAAGAEGI